ncbi:MAG: DUF4827 domain-containing protein [Bacteroidaceae bacterium]|nr:DUF4827 domain-containing protein [Bacteroidaceae bacterium]
MNKVYRILSVFGIFLICMSCRKSEQTYSEQKKQEREVVSSFLNRRIVVTLGADTLLNMDKIKVISEEQFINQDSITNVSDNEYVFFSSSGIYMQIVREGAGERIEHGENRRLMCRFWEYNILGDSLQLTNRIQKYATRPEFLNVSNNSGYISGSFDTNVETGSLVYSTYGDTNVPSGWLKPLEYVRVGAQTDSETRIAKVRLIVPHSAGHSHALASVYPCFYELTFQEDL